MKKISIALIQTKASKNQAKNSAQAMRLAIAAAKKGANIICLPELYSTLYFPQQPHFKAKQFAEPIPGPSTALFSKIAKSYGSVIIVPVYEKDKNGRFYNSAALIDHRGRLSGVYRKIHLPHDPGFYEKNYFRSGDRGYAVTQTKFGRIAVLICYDQWYPEAARAVRLAGAEIIFYPTALGYILGYKPEDDWHEAWEISMRGHAIANSIHVAAVNRVGREGRMQFFGQSFISDPFGKVLKRASNSREEILMCEINLSRNEFFAEGWGFLRNRRPDTYKILTGNKFVSQSKKLKNVPHYKDEKRALGQI